MPGRILASSPCLSVLEVLSGLRALGAKRRLVLSARSFLWTGVKRTLSLFQMKEHFCIQLRICWILSQILSPVWLFIPWTCPVFWSCLVRGYFLTALCFSCSCLWIIDRCCLSWFCSWSQMNQHQQEGHEYESSPPRPPDVSHFLTCSQQSVHAAEFTYMTGSEGSLRLMKTSRPSPPHCAWVSHTTAVSACMSVHLMQSQMHSQQWFAIVLEYTSIRASSLHRKKWGDKEGWTWDVGKYDISFKIMLNISKGGGNSCTLFSLQYSHGLWVPCDNQSQKLHFATRTFIWPWCRGQQVSMYMKVKANTKNWTSKHNQRPQEQRSPEESRLWWNI